jgi:KUP system potassium uptake protein
MLYLRETCLYLALILTLSVPRPCEQTDALFWPVFVIATLAAMIASQAMISATFSCVKQSMALGCFPRLKIVHTSRRRMGQIYIPVMNWFLMTMCIVVVAVFQSTTDIANAYG